LDEGYGVLKGVRSLFNLLSCGSELLARCAIHILVGPNGLNKDRLALGPPKVVQEIL
jgi:hypothetical protein